MDLGQLFSFREVRPLEIIVRGTATYWFLFGLFRFLFRRNVGSLGIADVLLLVLIADASQNAMAGSYDTVLEGWLLVAVIAGWAYLVDWAAFHFQVIGRWAEPPPLELMRDGRMLRRNMRRELVTEDELRAQLRAQGIEDFADVRRAVMESDGEISVIRREPGGPGVDPTTRRSASRKKLP